MHVIFVSALDESPARACFSYSGFLSHKGGLTEEGRKSFVRTPNKKSILPNTIGILYTILTEKSMYGTTKEKGPKNRPFSHYSP